MASKVIVTKNKLNAIGDAIREKTGTEDKYFLNDMPDLIRNISGGGGGNIVKIIPITLSIGENGLFPNIELFEPKPTITSDFELID